MEFVQEDGDQLEDVGLLCHRRLHLGSDLLRVPLVQAGRDAHLLT